MSSPPQEDLLISQNGSFQAIFEVLLDLWAVSPFETAVRYNKRGFYEAAASTIAIAAEIEPLALEIAANKIILGAIAAPDPHQNQATPLHHLDLEESRDVIMAYQRI